MSTLLNKTLSQIVRENYQAAYVFEKYGLDFCCKGKRPLKEACDDKQVAIDNLLSELNIALSTNATGQDFDRMSLTELSEYIIRVHHGYVKQNIPQIDAYLSKLALKHGDTYPYLKEVYALFSELQQELTQHMLKEERILFPRIKQLEFFGSTQFTADAFLSPINIMEEEHDHAGTLMQKIREITSNYEAPEQACTTHRVALAALKGFEEDLHQHVHLENNILFPKAIEQIQTASSGTPSQCKL